MGTFKAIVIDKGEAGQTVRLTDFDENDLMDGDVTVAVEYSTVNYKDGLAVTGKAPVVRRFPMIAGVDFSGTVEIFVTPGLGAGRQSHPQRLGPRRDPSRRLCAEGAGQRRLAGAAAAKHQRARGHGDRHRGLYRHALGDGAGARRRHAGRAARSSSPAPPAASARSRSRSSPSSATKLPPRPAGRRKRTISKALGATEIIDRKELSGPARPLAKERWAGGIDAVGSTTLANVLSMTRYGGAVAACGLAGGMDLPTSVAPFILRGVSLLGIDSVMCPLPLRQLAWHRLERDLPRDKIAAMTTEIGLGDVIEAGRRIVEGQVRGRIVVKIG